MGGWGQRGTCPLKFGKIFSGNYYVKFEHFSGKNHVKFGNFVNFSGTYKISSILIIFNTYFSGKNFVTLKVDWGAMPMVERVLSYTRICVPHIQLILLGCIIPMRTRFQTTGSARFTVNWLLMMYGSYYHTTSSCIGCIDFAINCHFGLDVERRGHGLGPYCLK